MAGPLASIAAVGMQNVAQQPPRPQLEKATPSKFDAIIDKKAEQTKPVVEASPKIFVQNIDKTRSTISAILSSLEQGNNRIDAMLKTSMSKKSMSNQELLAMQAGMYRYTQELDLCSKVVDKAVNGLKDVLKTQV